MLFFVCFCCCCCCCQKQHIYLYLVYSTSQKAFYSSYKYKISDTWPKNTTSKYYINTPILSCGDTIFSPRYYTKIPPKKTFNKIALHQSYRNCSYVSYNLKKTFHHGTLQDTIISTNTPKTSPYIQHYPYCFPCTYTYDIMSLYNTQKPYINHTQTHTHNKTTTKKW